MKVENKDLYETRKQVRLWLRKNTDRSNPKHAIMVNAVVALNEALRIIHFTDEDSVQAILNEDVA